MVAQEGGGGSIMRVAESGPVCHMKEFGLTLRAVVSRVWPGTTKVLPLPTKLTWSLPRGAHGLSQGKLPRQRVMGGQGESLTQAGETREGFMEG